MSKKTLRILIHPLFIYTIIALLECISFNPNAKKEVLYELPYVGDNFGILNSQAVYYYSGKGKYEYTSPECYFSYGNPTFDKSYKEGGIKTIDQSIADQIPLLGSMCDENTEIKEKNNSTIFLKRYFSRNYLLNNFSSISHVLFYILLSMSIIFHFNMQKYKYGYAFLGCFLGGAILELIQKYYIFGRTASVEDQVLNSIGAILGILLFHALDRFKFIEKYK